MKPNATRAAVRTRPCAALCFALLLHAAAAAAAPLPEPVLRLSATIAPSSLRAAVPTEERDLLRVEWQAARSRQDEADVVGDIMVRVRRMDDVVVEIRRLLEARPAAAPPRATPDDTPFAATSWASPVGVLVAAAIGLLFFAWLRVRRHTQAQRQAHVASAAPTQPMPTQPPAPAAKAASQSIRRRPAPAPVVDFVLEPVEAAAPPVPTAVHLETPPAIASEPVEIAAAPAPAAEHLETTPAPASEPGAAIDFEMVIDLDEAAAAAAPALGPDPAIELADIMLSMGLAHGAAETLSDQIRKHPKQALYQWLKLLDIYRSSSMQKDFERAAQDMRQYFNVQAKAWEAEAAVGPSLEDYPRLAEKLLSLWPGEECAAFLAELLVDNRGGARNGFPQSVAEEILLLQSMLAAEVQSTD